MKNNLKISLVAFGMIFASSYQTLKADSMKEYAQGIIIKQKDPVGSDGYYSGGRMTLQTPTMNLNLINAKAPSVKAGCGGIDLAFGSIQFLDVEKIVQFLQATLSNAAGVAFDLALKAACEECSETLKSMEAMANQINNMSLDSCQAAKAGLDAIGLTKMQASGGGSDGAGDGTNWIKASADSVTEYFSKTINPMLNSLGADAPKLALFFKPGQAETSSMVHYLIGKNTHPLYKETDFLRAISGDIFLKQQPSGKNPGIFYYARHLEEPDIKKFIKWRIGTSDSNLEQRNYFDQNDAPISKNSEDEKLEPIFTQKVYLVLNKIATREAHNSDDIAFLSGLNYPVYRIFNALSVSPESRALANTLGREIGALVSAEVMFDYLSKYQYVLLKEKQHWDTLTSEIKAGLAWDGIISTKMEGSKPDVSEDLTQMIKNVSYAMEAAMEARVKAHKNFAEKLRGHNEAVQASLSIRSHILKSKNPEFYNNLVTSSMLEAAPKK